MQHEKRIVLLRVVGFLFVYGPSCRKLSKWIYQCLKVELIRHIRHTFGGSNSFSQVNGLVKIEKALVNVSKKGIAMGHFSNAREKSRIGALARIFLWKVGFFSWTIFKRCMMRFTLQQLSNQAPILYLFPRFAARGRYRRKVDHRLIIHS